MNILLTLLNEQLKSLLHADAEITENKSETLLTYPNPYGGKPLQVLYRPAEDFKVTLNKTPRYYQQDSTKRLLADVADYAEGKTVFLDCTDHSGVESRSDRVTKAADAENLTLDSIIELSIRINLLNPVELKDLLANGGTVNVHSERPVSERRHGQRTFLERGQRLPLPTDWRQAGKILNRFFAKASSSENSCINYCRSRR